MEHLQGMDHTCRHRDKANAGKSTWTGRGRHRSMVDGVGEAVTTIWGGRGRHRSMVDGVGEAGTTAWGGRGSHKSEHMSDKSNVAGQHLRSRAKAN